jgi:hypothetical protein
VEANVLLGRDRNIVAIAEVTGKERLTLKQVAYMTPITLGGLFTSW